MGLCCPHGSLHGTWTSVQPSLNSGRHLRIETVDMYLCLSLPVKSRKVNFNKSSISIVGFILQIIKSKTKRGLVTDPGSWSHRAVELGFETRSDCTDHTYPFLCFRIPLTVWVVWILYSVDSVCQESVLLTDILNILNLPDLYTSVVSYLTSTLENFFLLNFSYIWWRNHRELK